MLFSLLKFIHSISIVVMFGSLGLNAAVLHNNLSLEDLRNVLRVQATFWLSLCLTCVCGTILLFFVGKPSQFYLNNPIFTAKIVAFISAIFLTFPSTAFLLKARKSPDNRIETPKILRLTTKAVFLLLIISLLLAFLVARGIGLQ